MSSIAIIPIGGWFMMSGFIGAKVRMSLAKFLIRTTGIVYGQFLSNKSTNNFWPATISR